MLKKMVKVMVATIMVMVSAVNVSAADSKMETAKAELIERLNKGIEFVNNNVKEKGLDPANYYAELEGTEDHYDGIVVYSVANIVLNGDTYKTVFYSNYDCETESYGRELLGIYSELDDEWFTTDEALDDIIDERYPECQY